MRKRYSLSLIVGMIALGASAQTQFTVVQDMTSKIANADFKTGSPVAYTIRTYDYDIPDQIGFGAGGEGLFGQQEVPGWTAQNPSDNKWMARDARTDGSNARAAGVFAYDLDSEIGLGGDYFPRIDGGDTQGLGMVAVWGADLKYTQEVSLPKGDYLLIAKVCNIAGEGTISNNFGFRVSDDVYYRSSTSSFPLMAALEGAGEDIWVEDTVIFRLEADVTGEVVLGFSFGAGSGSVPHLFVDNVRLLQVDPSGLDQQKIAEAKATLKELIDEGKRLGVSTSESEAVYNNASATLAQVEAAIEKQKALNDDAITDLSEFFIMNPHFTQDDPITDGICTYDYDMATNNVTHYGMQPVKSWVASNPSQNQVVGDENIQGRACGVFETGSSAFIGGTAFTPPVTLSDGSTGKVLGFVTCWSKTTQYTQHVTLPAGSYTLTISYYNSGGTGAVAKNLIGFIADGGTEFLGETTSFPVGSWGKETVVFTLYEETEGEFSLGYTATNSGSASMPHFFLDGISLFYEGELQFDPSLFALQGIVRDAETYADQVFYSALKADFEAAISDARSLVSSQSSDAVANKAAMEKITGMLQDVLASIADYERLQKFYDAELVPAEEKYAAQPDIKDRLIALDDDIYDALQSGEWDKATIDEVIASLPAIIKEETQKAWDAAIASGSKLAEALDISPLFDTLGYTYSTTAQQGGNVPDKQWQYGSAGNFKTQYGTAEVWSQSPFEISQTIADLPAGTYTVTTRAFYRTSDNATNYSSYDPSAHYAFIFAGHNRAPLTNVVEVGTYEEGLTGYTDAGGLYVPNSQQAAYNVFNDETLAAKCIVSTATVLTETGDLTFGITADQLEENSWVIWYTFEIAYNAVDESVINDELQALIDEAQDVLDGESDAVFYIGSSSKVLTAAIQQGQSALNAGLDEKKSAMSAINAAIKQVEEGAALLKTFEQMSLDALEVINEIDFASNDDEFVELANKMEEAYFFDTNEDIQKAIDRFPIAQANYYLNRVDFNDAALDDPIDISGVILNNSFSSNAQHWTIVGTDENGRIGQNQGYQSASYSNEEDGVAIDHFIEAWRPDGALLNDGTISQTLVVTLPEGYYRLACDGLATNQTAIPDEGIQGVGLYAQNGSAWDWTSMAISETAGKPQHFERDFYADGTSVTKVGIRVSETNASWITADNFKLFHLGKISPDAVTSLNADVAAKADIYNLQGMKTSATQRGLYIVVRNGKAQKVLVK